MSPPSTASPSTEPGAAAAAAAATMAKGPPGPRKSRPLRRKTSHSVIERRRREKINEGLIHLQHTVPACRQELRELLECKVSMNKKNARRAPADLQDEVDRLLEDKIASQMVLEKLCIISHTVDYVQELQEKVQAYRRLCRCSPPLATSMTNASDSHKQAHMDCESVAGEEDGVTTPPLSNNSDDGEGAAKCEGCATMNRGKRHWGSNRPLHLNRLPAKPGQGPDDEEKKKTGRRGSTSATQRPKRKAAPHLLREDTASVQERESEDGDSNLELEDWDEERHVCPSQLYTNVGKDSIAPSRKRRTTLDSIPDSAIVVCHPSSHDRGDARLGLLAAVSAGTHQPVPERPDLLRTGRDS